MAKQKEEEKPEEVWRRQIEIKKECNFSLKSVEELLISKYMAAAITDKKITTQNDERKNTGTEKKNDQIIQAKHIRKEEQQKYDTGGINFGKRRTHDKRRTDTKNRKSSARDQKLERQGIENAEFAEHRTDHHYINVHQ